MLQANLTQGQVNKVNELVDITLVCTLRVHTLAVQPETNEMEVIIGLGNPGGGSAAMEC